MDRNPGDSPEARRIHESPLFWCCGVGGTCASALYRKRQHVGLYMFDDAKMDKRCAIYEHGKLDRFLIAYLAIEITTNGSRSKC